MWIFFLGVDVGVLLSWLVVWLVLYKVPAAYRRVLEKRGFRKGRRADE